MACARSDAQDICGACLCWWQGEGIGIAGDRRGGNEAVGAEAVVTMQEARGKAIIKTEKPGLEKTRDVMGD